MYPLNLKLSARHGSILISSFSGSILKAMLVVLAETLASLLDTGLDVSDKLRANGDSPCVYCFRPVLEAI